jgi:hypothetical protein
MHTHKKKGVKDELFFIVPDIDHSARERLAEVLHDFKIHGILQCKLYPIDESHRQQAE